MAKDKRVEVLFESGEYRLLEEVARSEGKSVGGVIREAVEKYVVRPQEDERRKAWEELQLLMGKGGPAGSPEAIKEEILRAMDEAIRKSLETD